MTTPIGPEGKKHTSRQTDPLVGRRLASYEILSRVARGGMGVVYKARHVYIDKIVAIKVLDQSLTNREDLISRFRTEAQSLARVDHDNVIKVIDILEDKGLLFTVMDFAEGRNLRALVKSKGPLPADIVMSVACQTAEALLAAHHKGILHRDIKPENLILNSRGRCSLADFGLAGDAKLIEEGHEGPLTFGTPAYSAPEVLKRGRSTKRSDIFSFGATLYHLCAGEAPFGPRDAQVILLAQKRGAELIESRRGDLPMTLSETINACLSFNPADRPASFREVLEMLQPTVSAPVDATAPLPSGPTEVALDPLDEERRKKIKVAIAAAVAAIVIFVVVVLAWPDGAPLQPLDNTGGDATGEGGTGSVTGGNDVRVNGQPVKPGNDDGMFSAAEQAFNSSELDARTAVATGDYPRAFEAWVQFRKRWPDSPLGEKALERQQSLKSKVAELRETEFAKAEEEAKTALEQKRTADALGVWDRYPKALTKPLYQGEVVDVAGRIGSRRSEIVRRDSEELADTLRRADELREQWNAFKQASGRDSLPVRARQASALLDENALLEGFLPGRIETSRKTVEERLATLRTEIEAARKAAAAEVEAWRNACGKARGEGASALLSGLAEVEAKAAAGTLGQALAVLTQLGEARKAALEKSAEASGVLESREAILELKPLSDVLAELRERYASAEGVYVALRSELRALSRNGQVRDFRYRQFDSGDQKEESVTGSVSSVRQDDFIVRNQDGGLSTIKLERLTARTVRMLVRNSTVVSHRLSVVAWLLAVGATKEATTEAERLSDLEGASGDDVARVTKMVAEGELARDIKVRLQYFVEVADAFSGEPGKPQPAIELPAGSREAALLAAVRGLVAAPGPGTADAYIAEVRQADRPELVDITSLELAHKHATQLTTDDLRSRVTLEPRNASALAALAARLVETSETSEAKIVASRAIIADPTNQAAWTILKR